MGNTRISILLSPEDTEIPPATQTLPWCAIPSIPSILRATSVSVLFLLPMGSILWIGTDHLLPDQLLLDPASTNCRLLHSIIPNGSETYLCEQTCVPYAGVRYARTKRG